MDQEPGEALAEEAERARVEAETRSNPRYAWELQQMLDREVAEFASDPEGAAFAGVFVEAVAPRDAQERTFALHMALTHQVAIDCLKKSRKEELPDRGRQIELGLAARFLGMHARISGALDRHREKERKEREALVRLKEKTARETAGLRARQEAEDRPLRGGVVVEPAPEDPEAFARAMAEEVKARWRRAKRRYRGADPGPPIPDPPPTVAAGPPQYPGGPGHYPAEGRGVLVVPERMSEEDWERGYRAYQRALDEQTHPEDGWDLPPRGGDPPEPDGQGP